MESHLENNKYYVPEISEFHVGFEFEYKPKVGPWVKINYNNWMSPSEGMELDFCTEQELLRNINRLDQALKRNDLIRVKTLDQSDIESLGWQEFTYKSIDGFIMFEKLLTINYNYKEPVVDISYLPTFENQGLSRIFRGTIKNKSELIKLMQQLNIK